MDIKQTMIGKLAVAGLTAVLVLAASQASALTIRVSQESSAGAGDFNANVLGFITDYSSAMTTAGFYAYGVGNGSSYNGENNGGPLGLSGVTQTFFVNASDGLSLVTVHDVANDADGGTVTMRLDLSGDTANVVVQDDPTETVSVAGGGTIFTTSHTWIACCTDGYAVGSLDGGWTMLSQFTADPSGISSWQATSFDGNDITLVLATGRRARFDVVSEPGTLAVLGLGLVGLGMARRRKAA